jgi:hypothetical protein
MPGNGSSADVADQRPSSEKAYNLSLLPLYGRPRAGCLSRPRSTAILHFDFVEPAADVSVVTDATTHPSAFHLKRACTGAEMLP